MDRTRGQVLLRRRGLTEAEEAHTQRNGCLGNPTVTEDRGQSRLTQRGAHRPMLPCAGTEVQGELKSVFLKSKQNTKLKSRLRHQP